MPSCLGRPRRRSRQPKAICLAVDASMEGLPSVAFDAVYVPGGASVDPGLERRRRGVALPAGGLQAPQGHRLGTAKAKQLLDVLQAAGG
jgi:catalase